MIFLVTIMEVLQKDLSCHFEFSKLKTNVFSLAKVAGAAQRRP